MSCPKDCVSILSLVIAVVPHREHRSLFLSAECNVPGSQELCTYWCFCSEDLRHFIIPLHPVCWIVDCTQSLPRFGILFCQER